LATAAPLGDFGKALLGTDVEAVPPTGRSIDLPAVFVHEVRDELVVAERQYWGLLEFLVQIGVVGVSATRGAEAARRPGGSSSARDPQASTGQWPVAAALRREAGSRETLALLDWTSRAGVSSRSAKRTASPSKR
jgi:hypothetical protein